MSNIQKRDTILYYRIIEILQSWAGIYSFFLIKELHENLISDTITINFVFYIVNFQIYPITAKINYIN